MEFIFKKSSRRIKNLKQLKGNIFIIYSPGVVKIEPATCAKVDTELFILLPRNSKGFITSVFWGDEISKFCSKKQRLWVELFNKFFEETVKIEKNQPLGFFAIEPENFNFKYETKNKKKRTIQNKKSLSKKKNQKQKRPLGGFLNRYDVAYAGRDIVNQASKVASGVIKTAANNINVIATDRINQIINQVSKELEHVLPKILRGVIEDIYQTPFRLLRNFGKQQLNKIQIKLMR